MIDYHYQIAPQIRGFSFHVIHWLGLKRDFFFFFLMGKVSEGLQRKRSDDGYILRRIW